MSRIVEVNNGGQTYYLDQETGELVDTAYLTNRATQLPVARPLTEEEQSIMSQGQAVAAQMMRQDEQERLVRLAQMDNAIEQARAFEIASRPFLWAPGLVIVALMGLAWIFRALGPSFATYVLLGVLLFGGIALYVYLANRTVSLRHTPAGVALESVKSRERIAKHVLDRTFDYLEKRLEARQ